jgi:hypothetical protein
MLEKEAKEKVRQRKHKKKPRNVTVDITTVQQQAERYKAQRERAQRKRQAMLAEQKTKKKKDRATSSLSIDSNMEDLMEQNWSDQPPFQTFLTSPDVFILPTETYQRGDEYLILMAGTYVYEDGNVYQRPSRGKFEILKQNQMGSVQLIPTEGVVVEDPWYIAFMEHLNKRPHSVTTSLEWKELEEQNHKLFFPIRLNTVSRRKLCPNTEEEKNGFGTFMMGPSSKEYENHVIFQKLRYNIPKIFDTMLEMHQDKGKWDKTRESCILHLDFSSGTNQQSQMLTKAIDATAITAKPEMNGKQDGSLDEFHRIISPILSLLSNTTLVYL